MLLVQRRRFHQVNAGRLQRAAEAVNEIQRGFLDLLPLLLHTNHPLMPGYTERSVAHGISDYQPAKSTLRAAKKTARSFSARPPATWDIHALFLMGSAGTIAQSASSDFDIWVCHRPGLDPNELDKLNRKCESISRWSQQLDLEVHFFLMSDESFREHGAESLSSESSGTAQRHLLLDEFYRSAILVAGRPPLWWVVPADWEHAYDEFVATLRTGRFIKLDEYLDFGAVGDVAAAEFLGATLWQLAKAITAPHKSLLKIMLLESYAADYPATDLLSLRFKRAVHSGEATLESVDPYLLLHDKVQEYLRSAGDQDRLELFRRCLYYKLDLPLSEPQAKADWRLEAAAKLAREWDWGNAELRILDVHRGWKVDRVQDERQALVGALTRSYRRLSGFAREHADDSMVSQRDMTILGRKLFAAFEQKAGKIERVNLGFPNDLSEPHLTLQSVNRSDSQSVWLLTRGCPGAGDNAPLPVLKRGWSALELSAWSHFNGLLTSTTRLMVTGDTPVESREVEAVKEHLRRHLPVEVATASQFESFAAVPGLRTAALYVNLDADPLGTRHRDGAQVTTTRVDALSFSGWRENLVQEIEYLIITTWGEILTFRFQGLDGLMACLCEHLRWIAASPAGSRKAAPVQCYAPRHAAAISVRMTALFAHVAEWFASTRDATGRYIIRGADRYYVLRNQNGSAEHAFSGKWAELLDHLGRPNETSTSTTFDACALDDPLVARVLEKHLEGRVQFFFQGSGDQVRTFVLDEHGALFCDQAPLHTEATLLAQSAQFFESIRLRQNASANAIEPDGSELAILRDAIDFYRIEGTSPHGYVFKRLDYDWPTQRRGYLEVRVIGEVVDAKTIFTLFCDGREFSTQQFGQQVFERVVEQILSKRQRGTSYPVHITDIDLSRLPLAGSASGRLTIHYLQYKKRIERQLNRALDDLTNRPAPATQRDAESTPERKAVS